MFDYQGRRASVYILVHVYIYTYSRTRTDSCVYYIIYNVYTHSVLFPYRLYRSHLSD